jgi:hypothetical protein
MGSGKTLKCLKEDEIKTRVYRSLLEFIFHSSPLIDVLILLSLVKCGTMKRIIISYAALAYVEFVRATTISSAISSSHYT